MTTTVSPYPVIRPATCFRGRVLVLNERLWPTLRSEDLDEALREWLNPLQNFSDRGTVFDHCRQPGLDDRQLYDFISLDLVAALRAKPWSNDCRFVEEARPDGQVEQGRLRNVSEDEEDGCWLREGLWVGTRNGQLSYAAHWWLGTITGITFNDGRILDTYPLRRPCGLAGETIPDLTTGLGLPHRWARRLSPEVAEDIQRRLAAPPDPANAVRPIIVDCSEL